MDNSLENRLMTKVCHITSVHPPFDIRIFYKECMSLAKAGYKVTLIAPTQKEQDKNGIKIVPVKLPLSRIRRILLVTGKVFAIAKKENATIYHFHDPELIPTGILLKIIGKKVIFDIHENIKLSFISKEWLHPFFAKLIALFYSVFERFAILFFDKLVLAEDSYLNYYPKKKSTVILNFPLRKRGYAKPKGFENKQIRFIYSGVVHELKGIWETLNIIAGLKSKGYNVHLDLVGEVRPELLSKKIDSFLKDKNILDIVKVYGRVDFSEVAGYIEQSDIGMSILKPIPNYKASLPTKIFEYMQNGLPVITNDFELYKEYVEDSQTGICVSVEDINRIVEKIEELINNKSLLKQMSINGIELTNTVYNWTTQENKLLELYKIILQ